MYIIHNSTHNEGISTYNILDKHIKLLKNIIYVTPPLIIYIYLI